jgi:hypothetical protein
MKDNMVLQIGLLMNGKKMIKHLSILLLQKIEKYNMAKKKDFSVIAYNTVISGN